MLKGYRKYGFNQQEGPELVPPLLLCRNWKSTQEDLEGHTSCPVVPIASSKEGRQRGRLAMVWTKPCLTSPCIPALPAPKPLPLHPGTFLHLLTLFVPVSKSLLLWELLGAHSKFSPFILPRNLS